MWLGIDIGTSAIKAALFDSAGEQIAVERIAAFSTGEYRPENWWQGIVTLLGGMDVSQAEAVGVCGRGGTAVMFDGKRRVAGPSFDDDRARSILQRLREGEPGLSHQSLSLLAKAEFARGNGIDVALAVSAKDFAVWKLTGAFTTDAASGGMRAGMPSPLLLEASPPWVKAGTVAKDASVATGLREGTAVAVGWHDGAAATFGSGAAALGTSPVTMGTTAVYRVVVEELPPGLPRYWDLTPGLTVTGGDIPAAGHAFAWANEVLSRGDATNSTAGARGLTFLPQIRGRIAPPVNRNARGAWHGIDGSQTADDMLRAVLEGTAFALRQVRDWLGSEGVTAQRHIANGGGARNAVQAQVLADVLGTPIEVSGCEDGCRGAALLGAVAAGAMELEEARVLGPAMTVHEPGEAHRAVYDDAYDRFLRVQGASDQV